MSDCRKCAKFEECAVDEDCGLFVDKPIVTNYDILISKAPEALAKWIVEIVDCDECEEMFGFRMCRVAPGKACEDCWAGWLKSPVEGKNDG